MFNYLIKIEYDGTSFVGWQSQKNGKSVQDTIEKALKKVLKLRLKIIGAGRTDKGVQALSQYANIKYSKKMKNKKIFLNSINFFLKKNLISILDIKNKTEDFVVYDPYSGTGTTCKVAADFGFNFIGSETVKRYCDIAEERINKNTAQLQLL